MAGQFVQIAAIPPPSRASVAARGSPAHRVSATFEVGERALLLDTKRRRYLVELKEGGEFHSHAGFVAHGDIVGAPEGVVVRSTKGAEYTVLRPTLEDFVVEMPRGAQVIYPKDLAPICMLGDIGPGMRVFESGVGSGALSMTMLRWGADIVGYEIREDFANRARANVRSFLGAAAHDPLRRPLGEQLRRDRSRRRTVRPGRARPARTVAGRPARRVRAPGRRDPRGLHALDHPGGADPRAAQGTLDRRQDDRGAASGLAHRRPSRPTRPPHGGPHRVSCQSPVSWASRVTKSAAAERSITVRCRCTRRGTPRRSR